MENFYYLIPIFTFATYIISVSILVYGAIYITRFILVSKEKRTSEITKQDFKKQWDTLRIQAYERLILMLERMEIGAMIIRLNKPEMSATQLQVALQQAIREEFDYNISQQLYISTQAWERVRSAKENILKTINVHASKMTPEATSTDLASVLLLNEIETTNNIIHNAIQTIKNESDSIFNK